MQVIHSGSQRLLLKLPAGVQAGSLLQTGSATSGLFASAIGGASRNLGQGAAIAPSTAAYSWHPVGPTPAAAAAGMHPWDAAHQLSKRVQADAGVDAYVEPDFLQVPSSGELAMSGATTTANKCVASDFNPDWGLTDVVGWHLGDRFSQLKAARELVGDRVSQSGRRVRIGHLDTGYDPGHCSVPLRMHDEMAWNFVDNNNCPYAPTVAGGVLPDPSHGTGTLGLLAGRQVSILGGDFLGGAPHADIVPVRIGNTWLHLETSALSGGIDHAVGCGCDIISMSAGGIPAQSWADAVNRAYEAGCCIFAASGDSWGGLPTHLTIYPARFKRVVSVCGVTHDGQPYYKDKYKGLEGSWGPDSAMDTAISAFSPNVPWAKQGCSNVFDMDGSGTSAATPQAAAAGALWLQMHFDELSGAQPWQKVEAIRHALFSGAVSGNFSYLGNGKLAAAAALNIPFDASKLKQTPPDNVNFALFKELFGFRGALAGADPASGVELSPARQHMLEVEALQLVMTSPNLSQIVGDTDLASASLNSADRQKLIDAMRASPDASRTLRNFLDALSGTSGPSNKRTDSTITPASPQPTVASTSASISGAQSLADFMATAGNLTLADRNTIVEQALSILENVYVHLPFKRAMHAIDPVQSLKLLQERLPAVSEREFHTEMIFIFSHLRDLHTNYILPQPYQSRTAFLPFRIEEFFEGDQMGYIVTEVSASVSDPEFTKGVVVTHWNGIPIARAVELNGDREAGSNDEARRARGLAALTTRWMAMSAPPDEQWVVVRYRGTTADREIRFDWQVLGANAGADGSDLISKTGDVARAVGIAAQTEMERRMRAFLFAPKAVEMHKRMASAVASGADPMQAARQFADVSTTSIMPLVFKEFGTINSPGGNFGYIRIATFDVPSDEAFIQEFIRIVKMLPQNGLIIDVRGNGGGLIPAGERLLQVLTPGPIEPEPFQFINTQITLQLCTKNPSLSQWTSSVAQATQTGAGYSQGFPLAPKESYNDIGQVYQGPVLLIVDALCYSTTDIFAAGFQDHAIGKIIGTNRNTGAGGANVWNQVYLQELLPGADSPFAPIPNGASFRVAARRSTRVGSHAGTPVEDFGIEIKPEDFYRMTRNDVLNGNLDLKQRACQLLGDMPTQSMTSDVKRLATGEIAGTITTNNVNRLDLYVDGRPTTTLNVGNGTTPIHLPPQAQMPQMLEIRGFWSTRLVAALRVRF